MQHIFFFREDHHLLLSPLNLVASPQLKSWENDQELFAGITIVGTSGLVMSQGYHLSFLPTFTSPGLVPDRKVAFTTASGASEAPGTTESLLNGLQPRSGLANE